MADEIDNAQRRMEIEDQRRIDAHKEALKNSRLPAIGECHYCAEAFPQGDQRLFCDRMCADDHHSEIMARQRSGVRL
jgi:hypothetical protein